VLDDRVRAFARTGAAIVIGTNDLAAAASLATRIVFLNRGRVVANGSPAELMRAVAGDTHIDITLDALPAAPPAFPERVRATVVAHGYAVATAGGSGDLPAICDALVRAGARIRDLRVREPGLSEAFLHFAGDSLNSGPAAGRDGNHAREITDSGAGQAPDSNVERRRRRPPWRRA
jgi:ABC-2 type transport system ATP-binding protein